MAEISSELKSGPTENDDLNQNPGEFKMLVVEKEVLAGGHQGDVNGDDNRDGQQTQFGDNNSLLASQENEGSSTSVKINHDRVAGNGVMIREKPILMVTNELKPRLRWTHELHEYFLEAVNRLGGPKRHPYKSADEAKPMAILNMMDIEGLKHVHIKSHLQKYRLGKFSVKDWQDTSKNASQLDGGPQSLRPLSSVQSDSQTTQNIEHKRKPRARRARKTSKGRRGPLYLQLLTQSLYRRYLEAQRYLNTTLANQHYGSAAMENASFYQGPLASLGTFKTMPGPSDFGTVAALPQFHFNQHNACPPPTYDALTGQVNVGIQEVPFGYQPQTSLYPAPEAEDFSTLNSYPASSDQESLPVLPSSEEEMIWPDDVDLIEAFLNWNDDEPINLDNSFNCNNLKDCLN